MGGAEMQIEFTTMRSPFFEVRTPRATPVLRSKGRGAGSMVQGPTRPLGVQSEPLDEIR